MWRALNFERNSDKARRIRSLALQRGGKLTEGFIPKCDTSHDTANRMMTQDFGNRVSILADRNTNEVTVWVDGKKYGETYRDLSVPDFMQLQYEVQLMAASL
ncbi:MAG: hypothetical protein NC131_08625 [Roseburia sp.]|nr:hypothetical protein [Roseburia sp.]